MKVKPTIITLKTICDILGYRVEGWNDKKTNHNRIKLTEKISYSDMERLENELVSRFPEYMFAVGNVRWVGQMLYPSIATAITFWKKEL